MFDNLIEKLQAMVPVVIDYFLIAREFLGGILRPALPAIYIVSLLVTGILLWLTIYCISASQYVKSRVIEKGMDYFGVGDVGKYRQLRAWKHIIKRMKTNNPSNWKVAVLEADRLMDEILKSAGYRANTPDERFKQMEPHAFSSVDQIHEAHQIRNRVMREPDYTFAKEEALKVIRIYQQAFKENGLLD